MVDLSPQPHSAAGHRGRLAHPAISISIFNQHSPHFSGSLVLYLLALATSRPSRDLVELFDRGGLETATGPKAREALRGAAFRGGRDSLNLPALARKGVSTDTRNSLALNYLAAEDPFGPTARRAPRPASFELPNYPLRRLLVPGEASGRVRLDSAATLMHAVGIEPTTYGLRVRCSAN